MARHKVVACGAVLASYVESGQICHELTPVSVQRTVRKRNVSVSLCVPHCSRNSMAAKALRIRKVILGAENVSVSQVVSEMSRFYNERGRRFIAVRMRLDKPKRQETWTSPLMTEVIERMRQARARASKANDNESAKRFWMKSLKLDELDVGLSFGTLENELRNFSKAFEF